ncbi:MAG: hypothetical protein KFH98_13325 [Gemmatimonadetes bacterium]|nr:hypothetical protein [Gemmatimonadota bacterium]
MNCRMMGGLVNRLKRLIPLTVLIVAACDDPFGPAMWNATPDTVLVYSASRAEYIGRASALDITSVPVAVLPLEAPGVTGNWDIALTDGAGGLALVPASAFPGLESRSRIGVVSGALLADVTQAPRDTASYTVEPVPVRLGDVYIIRSRRASCGGASSGYRYGKLRPVTIDEAAGTLRFEIVVNPYCDNRSFVPPEE